MYKEIFEIDKKYPSLIMKIISKSKHTLKYFFLKMLCSIGHFCILLEKFFWRRWLILFQRRHFKLWYL